MFDEEAYVDIESRRSIYDCIRRSPGLHFREIQRRVGLATGSLDYHLHFLHKHGLVRTERTGKFLRYYPSNIAYAEQEKELLNLLRQETIRHILIYIIEKKRVNASRIASDLAISPSNLSRYLKILLEKNIVAQKKKGRFRFYAVADKKSIVSALVTYKASFLDKMVDRFIAAWEE